jgi:hypothetical protein
VYARVVRFSDVTAERIDEIQARINEADGPPPGVEASGMKLVHDADQGTAVFIGFFDDEEKMRAADEALQNMDADETPGTRQSIDQGEVKVERDS